MSHPEFNEIKPPQRDENALNPNSLFLAGSIDNGAAVDWQKEVALALSDMPVTIFNPRRDDWDPTMEPLYSNPAFKEQVDWELDHLDFVDVAGFYFAPGSVSPITLLELGLYAPSGRVMVCCPPGFWRDGNVEAICTRYEIPLYRDLESYITALRTALSGI